MRTYNVPINLAFYLYNIGCVYTYNIFLLIFQYQNISRPPFSSDKDFKRWIVIDGNINLSQTIGLPLVLPRNND